MFPIGIIFSFWRRKLFKFRNVSSELMFIILLSFSLVTASVGDKSENITSDNGNATSDVTEVFSNNNNENLEENHTVAADANQSTDARPCRATRKSSFIQVKLLQIGVMK